MHGAVHGAEVFACDQTTNADSKRPDSDSKLCLHRRTACTSLGPAGQRTCDLM
jgi:hypothetical protein